MFEPKHTLESIVHELSTGLSNETIELPAIPDPVIRTLTIIDRMRQLLHDPKLNQLNVKRLLLELERLYAQEQLVSGWRKLLDGVKGILFNLTIPGIEDWHRTQLGELLQTKIPELRALELRFSNQLDRETVVEVEDLILAAVEWAGRDNLETDKEFQDFTRALFLLKASLYTDTSVIGIQDLNGIAALVSQLEVVLEREWQQTREIKLMLELRLVQLEKGVLRGSEGRIVSAEQERIDALEHVLHRALLRERTVASASERIYSR